MGLPRHQRLVLACAFLLTALLCGCSGQSGPTSANNPAPETADQAIPHFASLPDIAQLDALAAQRGLTTGGASKAPSNWLFDAWNALVSWVTGAQAVAASPGASIVGETLELDITPGQRPGFAVYGIPADTSTSMVAAGLISDHGGGLISDKGSGLLGDNGSGLIGDNGAGFVNNRVYALANFEEGRWEFVDAAEEGLIDVNALNGTPADYISPFGQMFIAPLVFGPAKITGVTPLGKRAGDTTPAPALSGLSAAAVRGGALFNWSDLGPGPLVVKLYLAPRPFDSIDEEGVFQVCYPANQHEALFDTGLGQPLYYRGRVHHIFSGQDSALTGLSVVTALPGDPLAVTLDATPAESEPGAPVTVTATGGTMYDWDLNGDGNFEVFADSTGTQQLPDGLPGPTLVRVRGYDGADGRALRSLSVMRRGWVTYTLDSDNDTGGYIQLIRLNNGRLGAAYNHSNQGLRYAISDNANPLSQAEWSTLDLPLPSGGLNGTGIGHDLALINGKPAVAANMWQEYELWYAHASTEDGALGTDWEGLLVDPVAGSGGSEGIALEEVQGSPAIAYIGARPDGTTPDPTDTTDALIFNRSLDADGTTWGAGVEIDSANTDSNYAYFGWDCDLEVIAGLPAIVSVHTGASGQASVSQIVYSWSSQPDGSSGWSNNVVDDQNSGVSRGCLIDCGGVPGFVLASQLPTHDLQFVYGAGSLNAGPGTPWQFTTIRSGGPNDGFVGISARYHNGMPWMVSDWRPSDNSGGIWLRHPADGQGSAPWSEELAVPLTSLAAADVVLEGGKPVIAYVGPGFNVNARIAIRY